MIWVSRSMRSTTIITVGLLERRVQPQLLRGEDHQQRLARALEVPDQALLRIRPATTRSTIWFVASYCW